MVCLAICREEDRFPSVCLQTSQEALVSERRKKFSRIHSLSLQSKSNKIKCCVLGEREKSQYSVFLSFCRLEDYNPLQSSWQCWPVLLRVGLQGSRTLPTQGRHVCRFPLLPVGLRNPPGEPPQPCKHGLLQASAAEGRLGGCQQGTAARYGLFCTRCCRTHAPNPIKGPAQSPATAAQPSEGS